MARQLIDWEIKRGITGKDRPKIGGLKMSVEKSEILVMERKRTVVKRVDTNGRELGQVEDFKYQASVMEAEDA